MKTQSIAASSPAASYLTRLIESESVPWAAPLIAGALGGEPGEAGRLVSSVPSSIRGHVVHALFRARIPPREFGEALDLAWSLSHASVLDSVNRGELRAMFRYSDFSIPSDFPPLVQAWRGFADVPLAEGKRGLSWTLNRDVACFFAMRFETRKQPLVITASVPRSAVLHYTNDRQEHEVILFDVRDAAADGNIEDWAARAAAYQSARRQAS